MLREWIGTWTQAVVPYQTAKLWTAATIDPLDCGSKKPEPGQQLPQLPIDLENAYGRAFRSTCLEAARTTCPQLAASCAAQWEQCDTSFWQRCDDGWTVAGRAPELCKLRLCLGWSLPSPSQMQQPSTGSRGSAFRTT